VRLLVKNLLRRCGYTVLEADSGVAALEIWRTHRDQIQLLLTDMVMPQGMSGHDLAARLLAEKPGLKVIYTSGYSAEIVGGGLLMEGVSFLQKPYQPVRLAEVVRRCLDQK
jgi:CheY-like chemotaxis protein